MTFHVIWIDRDHAKLFQFSEDKMERMHLNSRHQDHHSHPTDNLDIQHREKSFFHQIALQIHDSNQILVLGPGVAKNHFMVYLREHFPLIAKHVIGCEVVDHPTDAQIAAYARQFFKIA